MALDWDKLDAIYSMHPFGWIWDVGTKLSGIRPKDNTTKIIGEVSNNARQEYLADREHTEMREDTAYQRVVQDMQKAGLNPYTIGASPSNSSVSSVGENTITSKLQILGYILDLKNLDLKNKQVANQSINTLINGLKLIPSK